MVPFNRSNRAVGSGRFGLFQRQLRIYFHGIVELHFGWLRWRRVPDHDALTNRIEVSHALGIVRHVASQIPRTGWRQYYLPADTESVQEHVAACVHDFLGVAREIGLSPEETLRGVLMLEVHELDEVATGKDEPLIPTRDMPRSGYGREIYQNEEWVPPTREQEIARLKDKFVRHRPLLELWLERHVPDGEREDWMELLREFHWVDTFIATICFEVHALQAASKAVFLALEEGVKFTPARALPFIRRAERLITHPHIKARLEVLKAALVSESTKESVNLT